MSTASDATQLKNWIAVTSTDVHVNLQGLILQMQLPSAANVTDFGGMAKDVLNILASCRKDLEKKALEHSHEGPTATEKKTTKKY